MSSSDSAASQDYRSWREALREQVEQEIDEQVRLRLCGGHRLAAGGHWRTDASQSASNLHGYEWLPPPARTWTRKHNKISFCPSLPVATSSLFESKPGSLPKDVLTVRRESEKRLVRQSQVKPVSSTAAATAEATHSLRAAADVREGKLSSRFQYVNSKYGTPVEHLDRLQATGSFMSVPVDSSGCGNGPVVYCPPEANISLPTPTHVVATVDHGATSGEAFHGRQREGEMCVTEPANGSVTTGDHEEHLTHLTFESSFEGGNLKEAIQIGPSEYELTLCSDLYSNKHTQWFYFRVEGMLPFSPYTFHIVNLRKPDSLYNYGMQPLLYSEKEPGWRRVGYDIHYYKRQRENELFTLSWTMEFPHSSDSCYLAHCYPYPLSKLMSYVAQLELSLSTRPHVRCEELCKTLAGNTCPLLTITDFQDLSTLSSRAAVVITSRVHPGESNSSWMVEGLIDWLTSDTAHAKVLRSNYVFKVVPMLNPDGVVVGNSRTSLAGVDLNRVYKRPSQNLFPTIYHTKAMIADLKHERDVYLYVDLHGHSRKQNVFTYGCQTRKYTHSQFLNDRIFPFLLSGQLPGLFSFKSCKFSVQRCKESTGRVVTWRMGVSDAFTLESTFCGCALAHTRWQFCEKDLKTIGCGLGEAIYHRYRMSVSKSYNQRVLCELARELMGESGLQPSAPLPDLVQSTELEQPHSSGAQNTTTARKHKKRKASKILKEFMNCDLSHLTYESSTTGSDSENDEFEPPGRTKRQQRRVNKRSSITLPALVKSNQMSGHSTPTVGQLHSKSKSYELMNKTQVRRKQAHSSATARLDSTKISEGDERETHQQQRQEWRFINRYNHRSNGGIPMFSEERLKERAEKLHRQQASPGQQQSEDHSTGQLWLPKVSSIQEGIVPHVHARRVDRRQSGDEGCGNKTHVLPGAQRVRHHHPSKQGMHQQTHIKEQEVKRIIDSVLSQHRSREHRLHLPPALVKYISEMWQSNTH